VSFAIRNEVEFFVEAFSQDLEAHLVLPDEIFDIGLVFRTIPLQLG